MLYSFCTGFTGGSGPQGRPTGTEGRQARLGAHSETGLTCTVQLYTVLHDCTGGRVPPPDLRRDPGRLQLGPPHRPGGGRRGHPAAETGLGPFRILPIIATGKL